MKIPVLKIKDAEGNLIPINAIRGEKGKDAYEQAKDGGYTGTVEQFIALLNGLTATANANHYADFNNPHKVTAQQVGALPIEGGYLQGGLGFLGEGDANTSEIVQNSDFATIIRNKASDKATILALTNETKVDKADVLKLWFANGVGYSIYGEHNKPSASDVGAIPKGYYASDDLDTELRQGGSKMTVCSYHSGTLNTPHSEGLTVFAHGMVITNAYDSNYGTQLCMPSGEDAIYVRRLNGSGVSPWVKVADNGQHIARVATGTYKGTNTYGLSKPNTLTFDFVPLFVMVGNRGTTNINSGGTFIWINPGTTLNFINNGSNYWCYPSLSGTTLSWYNSQSASYQLNLSSYDYDYLAWG